jgi:hypothetical protein
MARPTPITPINAETVARDCQAHCFSEGPGAQLKSQVDKWRGGLSLGIWVVSGALVLLTAAVTVSMSLVPSLVRSAVSAEFDRRAERAAAPVGSKPTLTPQALASQEGKAP